MTGSADHVRADAPLAGVRVLDVSRFVSGPLCTFFLASLGAEVLAVERPGGESSRRLPPFASPDGGRTDDPAAGGMAIPYLKRFRGKRSVTIALDHAEGRDLVGRLARVSDVVVENHRPGVAARLGLDADELLAHDPALVYCALSGFGQHGPWQDRPAMDNVVQAVSGLMAKTGFADGPPVRAGATVGDFLTATFGAFGVVSALRARDATGRGGLVDVAMLDVLTALVWDEPVDAYAAGGWPVRTGNADPRGAPINTYATADGWVAMTLTSDEQWAALCDHMGRADLVRRWPGIRDRAQASDEVDATVAAWCAGLSTADAEAALLDAGVPAGAVREPLAARGDPQLAGRGLLEELRHPAAPAGETSGFLGPRLPIRFPGRVDALPPAEPLGASTDAVLAELCGLDAEARADLRARGVV